MSEKPVYRTEKKFLLPETQLQRLESKIRLIAFPDSNADETGKYEVRSLYFDSPDDSCYYECKAGVDNRKKYRIRIYNCSEDVIHLECKAGVHGKKYKQTVPITKENYDAILSGKGFGSEIASETAAEFDLKLKQGFLPKVTVAYLRTAYVYPAGNVRITIDRDISALPSESLFDASAGGIKVLSPGKAILEMKYDDVLPQAIMDIFAQEKNMSRCSFSKYVVCRDALKGVLR
jgi:hypothetical protein